MLYSVLCVLQSLIKFLTLRVDLGLKIFELGDVRLEDSSRSIVNVRLMRVPLGVH